MVERGVLYQRQHNTEGCDVASIAPLLNLVSRLCRSQRSETLDAIFKHCDFSTIENHHYIFVRAFGSPVPSLLKVSWQQLGACRKGVHRKLWFNSRRKTHIQIMQLVSKLWPSTWLGSVEVPKNSDESCAFGLAEG